jgi:hypothetical protein
LFGLEELFDSEREPATVRLAAGLDDEGFHQRLAGRSGSPALTRMLRASDETELTSWLKWTSSSFIGAPGRK